MKIKSFLGGTNMGSRDVCFISEEDGQQGICLHEHDDNECRSCDSNPFPGRVIPSDRVLRAVKKPKKVTCKICRKRLSDKPECPIAHFGKDTRSIAEKTVEYCGCDASEEVAVGKLSFIVEISDAPKVFNALDIQEYIETGLNLYQISHGNIRVIERRNHD
jgi:hypothetical protein